MMKNTSVASVLGLVLLTACGRGDKNGSDSGVSSIQSIYVKIGSQDTYLKATKADSASLAVGTQKCTLYKGTVVLLQNWPVDDGKHTFVTLRNPIPGCQLKKGYIFIAHIARQDVGTFSNTPVATPTPTPTPTPPTDPQVPGDGETNPPASGERRICKAPSGVNLRAEPSTSAGVVSVLPLNTIVVLKGETSSVFFKVGLKSNPEQIGWVSSEFVCTNLTPETNPVDAGGTGPFYANCSSSSVTSKLPLSDIGLRTYGYDELVYGTCRTMARIKELAKRVYAKTGFPIYVGDISAYGGGNLGRHATHVYGDDIDIAIMGNTESTECYTYGSACYSRSATRILIKEILAMGGLSGICFNDPQILNEFPGVVRYCYGHDDHYHIEWHG